MLLSQYIPNVSCRGPLVSQWNIWNIFCDLRFYDSYFFRIYDFLLIVSVNVSVLNCGSVEFHRNMVQYARVTYERIGLHIEAETKWPPISWRQFQMHFLQWEYINLDWHFIEVCSQVSNQQYSSTGSDNGLAPARRQAFVWTNDG